MLSNLPVLIVVILLMTAFLVPIFIGKNRRLTQAAATLVMALAAGLSGLLFYQVQQKGAIYFGVGGWEAPWGIEVAATPLSSFVVLVATSIVTLVMFSLPREQRDWPSQKAGWYITLMLLLTAALVGMTMANDMFNIYVFVEVTALATWGWWRPKRIAMLLMPPLNTWCWGPSDQLCHVCHWYPMWSPVI